MSKEESQTELDPMTNGMKVGFKKRNNSLTKKSNKNLAFLYIELH
jgi:hypothetical protein